MEANLINVEFQSWIESITERPSLEAINIGLFQSQDSFTAYLIGSNEYDPNNDDWACNEDFIPSNKYLVLNVDLTEWHSVQQLVVESVQQIINSGQQTILNCAPNVTVGFDDGDLEKVK